MGLHPLGLATDIPTEKSKPAINDPYPVQRRQSCRKYCLVLDEGDVLTHCFNGKPNGILDKETDQIKKFAKAGYEKGIVFDIGHGTDSFNFHVAETALKAGIKATSISTDIYHRNRENGPVYDLATTMEKLRVVGYSWEEILDKVTNVPAQLFPFREKR